MAAAEEVVDGRARRPLRPRRLPDRLRHLDQHERQRGHRQPRDRDPAAASSARKSPVHPNDHVNMGQSSNDVIPTAIHLAGPDLHASTTSCRRSRSCKRAPGREGRGVRRHHQDRPHAPAGRDPDPARPGVPGLRGPDGARRRRASARPWTSSAEVALGGTAVGTGVNTHPEFASRVTRAPERAASASRCGETENHFQAQSAMDGAVVASGAMKTVAVSL